jgi:hypothetical protein
MAGLAPRGRPTPPPVIGPTAMTIAMVGESASRCGTSDVVGSVARLAATDELVVVYGTDEHRSRFGVQPMVAHLRDMLPRHTVVVLYAAPQRGSLRREAALLDELLELGSLPIVVAPLASVLDVAAELHHLLRADRVLELHHEPVLVSIPPVTGIAA